MSKTFRDLVAWRLAIDLVSQVYELTDKYPNKEKFGLTNQMRRCSVSIPSNIAEVAARNTTKEFRNFLYIARGSLAELQTQFIIAHRLNYAPARTETLELLERLNSVINGLIRKLNS